MLRALSFLTIVGGSTTPDARTLRWFPLAGAVVGLLVGGAWWAADQAFGLLLAAALVVTADLVVTGLLHVDGLADCGDGLVAPMIRARRLQVMADPTVGAFGVAVVAAVLLLRVTAFASLSVDVWLVVAVWAASRAVMALIASTRPYARAEGLATSFLGDRVAPTTAVAGIVAAGALAGWSAGIGGAAAVAGVVVGAGAVAALAQRRIGGFTGDVLGAAGVVGETLALVVAAARW